MRQDRLAFYIVIAVIVVVLGAAVWVLFSRHYNHTTVRIGDALLTAELAVTPAQHKKGLGGRTELPAHKGMLFVFEKEATLPIWMDNMHMSIDIIWLNSYKKVVHVKQDVHPSTYPNEFTNDTPAQYVLEVPAGTVKSKSIQVGTQAYFDVHK